MSNFSREHIRSKLQGPVFPVLTPFTKDGNAVDHQALESYVRFLVKAGAPAIMTTVGTSRFNLLSDDEIKEVNRTVAAASSNKCITILAGPLNGNLRSNIEFAQHAEDCGADAYIAFFPERFYGDEAIYEFFKTISEQISIGTMIHEMPLRSGYGGNAQYSIELLTRLIDQPGIVGMKEECMDGGYAYKIHRRLGDKCGIIGAGAMRNFMRDFHAGARSNLVGVGTFFPGVEIAFHDVMKTGNIDKAHKIARRYEDPYFDFAVGLGWHIQLKETLDILGLMPAYERDPLPRLSPDNRARLKGHIEKLGWLELDPMHIPQ